MALSKLPSCFGLPVLAKGYFPHMFSSAENQTYIGPLPGAEYYSPENMTSAARASFMAWHKEHEKESFNFQEEMLKYCRYAMTFVVICL